MPAKKSLGDNSVGQWIRPVSSRTEEEISSSECQFENGRQPDLMDVLEISLIERRPNLFQCENHLIDNEYYWLKKGIFSKMKL